MIQNLTLSPVVDGWLYLPHPTLSFAFMVPFSGHYRRCQAFAGKLKGPYLPLPTLSLSSRWLPNLRTLSTMSKFHQQTARSGHTHHSPPCPSSSWWHVAAESSDIIDNIQQKLEVVIPPPCPSSSWLSNLRTPSTVSRFH